MSRRRAPPASSLELLLDTICNTFGGVVFISILIVVLLRMTGSGAKSPPANSATSQELETLHDRLNAALARLKTLRAAAAQQERLAAGLAPTATPGAPEEKRALRKRCDDLHDERLRLLAELGKTQVETNELNAKQAELDRSVPELRVQLAVAQADLDKEAAARALDAKLPKLHDTDKLELPLLVREGRMCLLYRLSADGSIQLNADECSMTGADREVAPLPGKGLAIDADGRNLRQISSRLNPFDNDDYYIATFVWPDSFAQFRRLKGAMVRAGFEYRLVPVSAGGKVRMGPASRIPVKVQ